MKLIEKEFKFDGARRWRMKGDGCLCNYGLRLLFSIPRNCETIWISLWDKPSPNREAFVVVRYSDIYDLRMADGDIWGADSLDKLLSKQDGKTLHVQVEYIG